MLFPPIYSLDPSTSGDTFTLGVSGFVPAFRNALTDAVSPRAGPAGAGVELTPEQLLANPTVRAFIEESNRTAAEAAVRALNTPDPAARPGGSGTAAVVRHRPQTPSLARAVRAAKNHNWRGAELERDFSQAARAVLLKDTTGEAPDPNDGYAGDTFAWATDAMAVRTVMEEAQIPTDSKLAAYRDLEEGTISVTYTQSTGGGAGFTGPQYMPELFELSLQPGAIVRAIPGVQTIPVNFQNVILPRESAKGAFAMVAEAGILTNSDATFASQTLTIRKGYAYRQYSNELLADANPALNRYLTQTLARDIALGQDLQFLEGSGSGSNITGLINYSNTTAGPSMGTNGRTPTADDFKTAIYNLRVANVEPNAWVMHPRSLDSVSKLKDANGRYLFSDDALGQPVQLPGPGTAFTYPARPVGRLLGMPVYLSSQINIAQTVGGSGNASYILLADWRFVKLLERQGVEIMVSEHIAFTTDETAIRATVRFSLGITQPAAVEVWTGVLP